MKDFFLNFDQSQLKCILIGYRYAIYGVAALLLLCFCIKSRRICLSSSKGGVISLTKAALREIVESVAYEFGIQERVRVRISGCRCKTKIEVIIKTGRWQNLSNVTSSLHSRLETVLLNDIGLQNIKKINIVVVGFRCKKSAGKEIPDETPTCSVSPSFEEDPNRNSCQEG